MEALGLQYLRLWGLAGAGTSQGRVCVCVYKGCQDRVPHQELPGQRPETPQPGLLPQGPQPWGQVHRTCWLQEASEQRALPILVRELGDEGPGQVPGKPDWGACGGARAHPPGNQRYRHGEDKPTLGCRGQQGQSRQLTESEPKPAGALWKSA